MFAVKHVTPKNIHLFVSALNYLSREAADQVIDIAIKIPAGTMPKLYNTVACFTKEIQEGGGGVEISKCIIESFSQDNPIPVAGDHHIDV